MLIVVVAVSYSQVHKVGPLLQGFTAVFSQGIAVIPVLTPSYAVIQALFSDMRLNTQVFQVLA